MKIKKIACLLLSLLLGVMSAGCQKQEEPDKKEMTSHENRIVALSVPIVDLLDKMGVSMVGIPNSQYEMPESVDSITKVGLPMAPNIETIASLKPTHILSLTTLRSMVEPKLKQIGIEGTFLNMENIDHLKETITELGVMFDREEEAKSILEDFETSIQETVESVKQNEPPKVLILFGFPGNYMVATKASFVGQMVELLGAQNVLQEGKMAYANVNQEELILKNPDIILRMTHGVKEDVLEMFDKEFKENDMWKQLDAVKNNKVYDLDDSLFNVSASLETATALKELAHILYE